MGIQNTAKYRKGGLTDLDNDFTPGVAGQNFVVRAEHVVELVHRIDDRLDLAYTRENSD